LRETQNGSPGVVHPGIFSVPKPKVSSSKKVQLPFAFAGSQRYPAYNCHAWTRHMPTKRSSILIRCTA